MNFSSAKDSLNAGVGKDMLGPLCPMYLFSEIPDVDV